jgi:hypothetical protein
MMRPNRHLQGLFLDLIAVCVLNPGVVADSSQVVDQTQYVLWVVRMYLRAAARTFRLHKHIHRSHLTLCVGERTIVTINSTGLSPRRWIANPKVNFDHNGLTHAVSLWLGHRNAGERRQLTLTFSFAAHVVDKEFWGVLGGCGHA